MNTEINQKLYELQLKLDQLHKYIETNGVYWKKFLISRMEMKVVGVLIEQLQKDEIEGLEFNKARDEFGRLKELFHLFNSQPLISLSNSENNQVELNAPRLVFPTVTIDGFNWIEDFFMENTVETMEHSHEQQIGIDEAINYTTTIGNYIIDF